MKISVATVFPDFYNNFLETSLIKRAQDNNFVQFDVAGFSSFCEPKERIDAPTVGHGVGMTIRPEVVERIVCAQEQKNGKAFKIFLTPQGKKLDQRLAQELAKKFQEHDHVMLFAARYEGIDARAQETYADMEVSIGDYILMGGDLPVMVLLESVLRYIPGVVGQKESVEKDSFSGAFLDFPTYTTPPRQWQGRDIPEILLSGNHAKMQEYRDNEAARKTVKEHFEWARSHCIKQAEREKIAQHIPAHYVALLHHDVIVGQGKGESGTSSVTSLDIHDIARSSRTYGIKHYFIATPLEDQKKIVQKMLQFWADAGVDYNKNRSEAVELVSVIDSLDTIIQEIEKKEGKSPLVVGTSARQMGNAELISYYDQEKVWHHDRPVLLIFGTARGISEAVLSKCDYLLMPLEGFSKFNHLSVRSAVAIILDRWMGINLR
ncbi:tRNA (guanosine(37)-N1)-methyltransferase TrmD [Candidatus Babeliales bacterium]|nr:tRNA (guanosine(37)-N1)-methyltransferase TrmD [Candidatus Babeliales bacterium]